MNPRTLLPIVVLLSLASCSSTGSASKPAAEAAPAPAGDAAAKDEKNEAIQKKERELVYAKLQFEITKLELEADERSQQNSIAEAERGVRRAEEELTDYMSSQKALDAAERVLGTDQQKEGLRQTQQEYDELESMYKDEDFAKKTKELVLSRGKARLDFTKRGMELSTSRREFQERVSLPRKERDLREALEKARTSLEETRGSVQRKALSNQLQLMRAKDSLDDLQKEVDKLKKPAA